MPHSQFLNLGSHINRNIINAGLISQELGQLIADKNLNLFPNIAKWINTVVKNYVLQKSDVNEVQLSQLPPDLQKLVKDKNISAPYHLADLTPSFIDSISHCIDYLKSSFDNTKDLSRISWEQAQINADVWLHDRFKNLSTEEDFENIITIKEIEKDGENYKWVNIRSNKALQRESKLMSHCIESYWENDYPNTQVANEETPYYSLRDKNNKPLVTLFREVRPNILNSFVEQDNFGLNYDFIVGEIKEKGNTPLSNNNRELVDILLEDKQVGMFDYEKIASHYYYTYVNLAKKLGPIKSINQIIKNELKFYAPKPLNIEDFENDFSKEQLYNIGNWKKLVVTGEESFLSLHAKEVQASNISNRGVIVIGSALFLKDVNKAQIILTVDKTNENIRFFENVRDTTITLLNSDPPGTYYVFKNCHNIQVNSKVYNKSGVDDTHINVLEIDSANIGIDLPYDKNILKVESALKYSFSIKDIDKFVVGNEADLNCSNKILRNKFFTEVLNKYLQLQSRFYEDNLILCDFIKQLNINVEDNLSSKFSLYTINNKQITDSTASMLNKFIRNTDETIKEIYQSKDIDTFTNYKKFVIDNSYSILKDDLLEEFPSSNQIISAINTHFQEVLLENRPLLVKTLLNPEDNFSEYMYKLFYNDVKRVMNLSGNKLMIYMLKNELINQAIENYHPENATNYRFAFAEKRLTKSNCIRWFDYLSPEFFDSSEKKEVVSLFTQSYDNNELLNKLGSLEISQAETIPIRPKRKI